AHLMNRDGNHGQGTERPPGQDRPGGRGSDEEREAGQWPSALKRSMEALISASATSRSAQLEPFTYLPGSRSLYRLKKCSIESSVNLLTSAMPWTSSQRGSPAGTASTLSSPPASSSLLNMPMGRMSMSTPGNSGSGSSTSTSSGSPSFPRVCSMKP